MVAPPFSVEVSTQKPLFGVAQSRDMASPVHVSCVVPPMRLNVRVLVKACWAGGAGVERAGGGVGMTATGDGDGPAARGLGESGALLTIGLVGPTPAEVEVSGSR
jgi:hypothetical protein